MLGRKRGELRLFILNSTLYLSLMFILEAVSLEFSTIAITVIIILAIIGGLIAYTYNLKEDVNQDKINTVKTDALLKEKDLTIQNIQMSINEKASQTATLLLAKWKETEMIDYRKRADEAATDTARLLLQRWMIQEEDRIRKDAANRSVRVVLGKVTEHLIPFSEAFSLFNPKDARFIGSPIDLIVFDGIEDKKDLVTIYFLEIKTGTSALSQKQKKIMEAVKSKRVEWLRLNIRDFGDEVNAEL